MSGHEPIDQPAPRHPAPRQGRTALDPGQPAGVAFARLLTLCAEDFERHRARLMVSDDPEGPHGARVALRRLRTVLLAFAPLLRRRPSRRLGHEARSLSRRLGRLRDADVLAATAAGRPEAAARTAEADRIRAEVRAELSAQDAHGFAARVADWLAAGGWRRRGAKKAAKGPVEAVAAAALDAAWNRQRDHGKRLRRMSVEERHGFRKDLKALRYQSDFFAPLWPGKRQARFAARLRALQDDLGLLNNLALAEARLGPEGAAAHAEAARAALAQAARDWRALRRSRRWWRSG
jgi:CHAD domain-containing protein